MNIGKWIKGVWKDIVNNESGQWGYTAAGKSIPVPKPYKTPEFTRKTGTGYTPLHTYTTPSTKGVGSTSKPVPTYSAGYGGYGVDPRLNVYTPPPTQDRGVTPAGAYTGGAAPTYRMPTIGGFPTYQVPNINLTMPNFAYAPTPEQTAAMQEKASTRAGLVIDPQRQAEIEALRGYRTEVQSQIGEINPRMTKMSLSLANVVENSIKQEIIDELIRRGATTSGELPRQLAGAGMYEAEQRGGIENERNRLIGALMKQQLGREELSGERLAELERLRGMQESQELFEQERYERGAGMAEKSALFEAQLAQAQLQYGAATAQYESSYKQKLFEAQMAQQQWERGYSEQELALRQASQAYTQQPAATGPEYLVPGTSDWYRYHTLLGTYPSQETTGIDAFLDWLGK